MTTTTATTEVTKKDKLLNTLRAGKRLTVDQIAYRFKFASRNSVYGTISKLRDEGYDIISSTARNGLTAYSF